MGQPPQPLPQINRNESGALSPYIPASVNMLVSNDESKTVQSESVAVNLREQEK